MYVKYLFNLCLSTFFIFVGLRPPIFCMFKYLFDLSYYSSRLVDIPRFTRNIFCRTSSSCFPSLYYILFPSLYYILFSSIITHFFLLILHTCVICMLSTSIFLVLLVIYFICMLSTSIFLVLLGI